MEIFKNIGIIFENYIKISAKLPSYLITYNEFKVFQKVTLKLNRVIVLCFKKELVFRFLIEEKQIVLKLIKLSY